MTFTETAPDGSESEFEITTSAADETADAISTVYADTDGDGTLDTAAADIDADGTIDTVVGDADGDGRMDTGVRNHQRYRRGVQLGSRCRPPHRRGDFDKLGRIQSGK